MPQLTTLPTTYIDTRSGESGELIAHMNDDGCFTVPLVDGKAPIRLRLQRVENLPNLNRLFRYRHYPEPNGKKQPRETLSIPAKWSSPSAMIILQSGSGAPSLVLFLAVLEQPVDAATLLRKQATKVPFICFQPLDTSGLTLPFREISAALQPC